MKLYYNFTLFLADINISLYQLQIKWFSAPNKQNIKYHILLILVSTNSNNT